MSKNILSLSSEEALEFFMKSEQFHGFELPEYFDFDVVLNYVKETIGDKRYEDCLAGILPDHLPNVNLDILLNKDGHYAVRPLILANPFLYYFLVRELCDASGWETVQSCFKAYTVPHIVSCALPVIPDKQEPFYKSSTILSWWNTFEQRSIELSLEYRYMFVTDITNCYGSINPQSIEWALLCKNTQHENTANTQLAENIQKYLRAMQHGHNIGIPQGSTLFDFVAEIILGYSDLLLHEAIQRKAAEYKKKKKAFPDYTILRYRDDYKLYCNDKEALEDISYILQSVLESLNFRMNSQKTKISDSIVTDSIKPDKLFYLYNTPIFNKKGVDFDSFEKHLLYILMFGRDYPNGGQLKTLLSDIDKRIEKWLEPYEVNVRSLSLEGSETKKVTRKRHLVGGSVRAMSAVCVQIALENVTVCHYALRVLSRMVDSLSDMDEKRDIIDKVYNKLCGQPNSDYNQLWLQNITYTQDKKRKKSPYTMRLCKLVMGDKKVSLWNNEWLKAEYASNLPIASVVNQDTLKKVTPVIVFRETRAYHDHFEELLEELESIDLQF